MQINLVQHTQLNTNKARCVNKRKNLNFFKQHFSLNQDIISFTGTHKYLTLESLMRKVVGFTSIEDEKKFESITNFILKNNDLKKVQKLIKISEDKNNSALQFLIETNGIKSRIIKGELKYIDAHIILSNNIKSKFKKAYISVLGIQQAKTKSNQQSPIDYKPLISDWFKTSSKKNVLPDIFTSLYVHPRDKAKYILGDYSKEDLKFIKTEIQSLANKKINIQKLFKSKLENLYLAHQVLINQQFLNSGKLKNKDLKMLKKLTLKDEILNQFLGEKVPNKKTEGVIINAHRRISSAKIGDYINDLGLVLNKIDIYDTKIKKNIPCLIVFNKLEKGNGLKLIKIDPEQEEKASYLKEEFQKIKLFHNDISKQSHVEKLNTLAKQILDKEKKSQIAQIEFRVNSTAYLNTFFYNVKNMANIKELTPYIDSIKKINAEEPSEINRITTLLDFINFDPKRYYNAGMYLAHSLIHLLQHNKLYDVFLIAHAIGKTSKSPLPLYLRVGAKPISPSLDIIQAEMQNLKRWDAKRTVYMYLPADAAIHNLVKKTKPLNEVFKSNLKNGSCI